MKLLLLGVVVFACSCAASTEEPQSGYFIKVEHRTVKSVASELASEFPEVELLAFGRNTSIFVYSRDESKMTMELLSKLEARVKELDCNEGPLSPK